MEQVSEGNFIAGKVLGFAENSLIGIKLGRQLCNQVVEHQLIGREAEIRLVDDLSDSPVYVWLEVVQLDRSGLLEHRFLFETCGKEGYAFVGILGSEISADSTAFKEDEAIVIDIGDLTERLLFQVLRRFMLAFHEIDVNQLERDLLLAQNNTNATRGGRLASSVELENHCDEM